jgi:hypothetical protein
MPMPLNNSSAAPFEEILGRSPTWQARQRYFQLVGFQPNQYQEPILRGTDHRGTEDSRAKGVSGGEQSGKSLTTSKDMGSKMPWCRLGWIVGPDYSQCRPELEYMIQDFQRIGLLDAPNTSTPREGPWNITLKGGARIRSISAADTVSKIANEAPDYVAMVEVGQMPEEAYFRCLGRTGPRAAMGTGWLFINGTLEGSSGWYPELMDRWKAGNPEGGISFELPSWSNEVLYPGGWDNPEIQRQRAALPDDVFMERFGGRRTPPRGLVFKEFDRFVHTRPIYLGKQGNDPRSIYLPDDIDLQLWIDPGYAGAYAVLFVAIHQDTVYVVDEIYTQYRTTEEVIQLAVTHPYWKNVTRAVMDIAGEQHQAMKSPAELWRASPERGGAGLSVTGQKIKILDGIARLRSFLRMNPTTNLPQTVISPNCQGFITELSDGYRWPLDRGNKVRSEVPVPKNNHAITAYWYGLVNNFGIITRPKRHGALPRFVPEWERQTLSLRERLLGKDRF